MMRRVLVAALGLAIALGGAAPAAADAGRGPSVPECAGPDTTDTAGLSGDATPVILVHGWTGSPLHEMRGELEQAAGPGFQYLLFDYSNNARLWAGDVRIHECLAQYLVNVSEHHRELGGDGFVRIVAHSMGGLAAQFAAYDYVQYGGRNVLAGDRLGGLITVDTPHLGSPWGNTGFSWMHDGWSGFTSGAIPAEGTAAWQCLAEHGRNNNLPDGCDDAPWLAGGTRVHQIANVATVRRTVFGGIPLLETSYDIPLSSDGIVSTKSQIGYAKDGPKRKEISSDVIALLGTTEPPLNAPVTSRIIECQATTDMIAAVFTGTLDQLGIVVTLTDWAGMGSVRDGDANLYTAELLAAVAGTECGHNGAVTSAATIADVTTTLLAWEQAEYRVTPAGIGPLHTRQWREGGDTGHGSRAALESLTAMFGEPDIVVPSGPGEVCDIVRQARWGDFGVHLGEGKEGGLIRWWVSGPDVPDELTVPFDLWPRGGESRQDIERILGPDAVHKFEYGWDFYHLDGFDWMVSDYEHPGGQLLQVTDFAYICD